MRVYGLRRRFFRQIVQDFCRKAAAFQRKLVQDDGIKIKQGVCRALCGVALKIPRRFGKPEGASRAGVLLSLPKFAQAKYTRIDPTFCSFYRKPTRENKVKFAEKINKKMI